MSAASKPNIDVCSACGKLHARVYVRLCANCATNENHRFDLVRSYIEENQGATIPEIADATGLTRGEIARFYAAGRLVEVAPDPTALPTECTCAADGTRCLYCRSKLSRKFGEMLQGGAPAADADAAPARVQYIRRARRTGT